MNPSPNREIHACILAGGLSSRMGEDKAHLTLGDRTLLQIAESKLADWPRTVIREDVVPRCGPIGGIITGFGTCSADRLLFLPCDMPFVSVSLLNRLAAEEGSCADQAGLAGFPLVIPRSVEAKIRELHERGEYSLQQMVRVLELKRIASAEPERELFNINTPEDFAEAKRIIAGG